jgi:hypothetical protein
MTDLVTKVTKSQTEFLEQVTLGRELPTGSEFLIDSNRPGGTSEPDPFESMPWPSNINEALMREQIAADRVARDPLLMSPVPSNGHLPNRSNRPGSSFETTYYDESQVRIEPV